MALLVSEEQTSASSVRALRLARLPVADAASTVGIASVKALIKTTSGMAKMSTRLILQLGLSTCWRLLLAVNLEFWRRLDIRRVKVECGSWWLA